MKAPVIFDWYCGAGGCAEGYRRAGFRVVGFDNCPQPHYPFEFVLGDATDPDFMQAMVRRYRPVAQHGSPPCQDHMRVPHPVTHDTGWMLPWTRTLFEWVGLPWVIENVPGAPMRADYKLCGCMFGLPRLRRERWFETSWHGFDLRPPCHHVGHAITVAGHGEQGRVKRAGQPVADQDDRKAAMGIDWMNRDELAQAIPPAFTEWVGLQLRAHLESVAA